MWNFPNKGSNLCFLQWRRGVLTTGSPGESDKHSFGHAEMQILRNKQELSSRQLDMVGMELGKERGPAVKLPALKLFRPGTGRGSREVRVKPWDPRGRGWG